MAQTIYTVVYRIGGTDHPTWRRTLGMSYDEAAQTRLDLIHRGYHALYPVPYDLSMSIGLPEGAYPQAAYRNIR